MPAIDIPPNPWMAGNGIRVLQCWAVRERTLSRSLIPPANAARPLSPAMAGHRTRPLLPVSKTHWRSLLRPPKKAGLVSSSRTNKRWRAAACQCRHRQGMESRASGTWLPTSAASRRPTASFVPDAGVRHSYPLEESALHINCDAQTVATVLYFVWRHVAHLVLIQSDCLPERYGASRRFETIPSSLMRPAACSSSKPSSKLSE